MGKLHRACLVLLLALLLAPTLPCFGQAPGVTVSPQTVLVDVNFVGADVAISGVAPAGAQAIVKVTAAPVTVKLAKKGPVLGLFWMTTEQALVEGMPAYFAVFSSQSVDGLLSHDEQVRLALDSNCVGLMSNAHAQAPSGSAALTPAEARVYVESLRDMYIKTAKYVPCQSCHRSQAQGGAPGGMTGTASGGSLALDEGRWQLRLRLPTDAPLGQYQVTAYYVQAGTVVDTREANFDVQKTGLVATLGSLATDSAPVYAVLSLGVVMLVGLGIGAVFPKARH